VKVIGNLLNYPGGSGRGPPTTTSLALSTSTGVSYTDPRQRLA
jgi:hypothetical protein